MRYDLTTGFNHKLSVSANVNQGTKGAMQCDEE